MKSLDRRTLAIAAAVLVLAFLSSRFGGEDTASVETTETTETVEQTTSTSTTTETTSTTDTGASETSTTSTTSIAVVVDEPVLLWEPMSNLPLVFVDELPPEAVDTLWLIEWGGPYPFDRDDTVFQNREGVLPDRQRGHYHEYTVITPGSPDRGARRIVAGEDGERYYTDDHYDSFSEVVATGSDS